MNLKQEQLDRFRKVAAEITGELVIVVAQVDPDALASALALKQTLEHVNASCEGKIKIIFCGSFSHPQNRSIFNHFDLGRVVRPISELTEKKYQVALVDSSAMADSRLPQDMQSLVPVIVIDHHKNNLPQPNESQFYWTDTTSVSSASTMVAELALGLKVPLNEMLNLLLALGIYTDTKALVDSHQRDRSVYGEVTKSLTGPQFSQLIHYSLPASYFRNLAKALGSMTQRKSFLVAGVGVVAPEDADDIATIAGHLGRTEGVTLAVVFGIVGDKVRLSARSSNPSRSLDAFLKERFGSDNAGAKLSPDGRSEGGALMNLDLGIWMSGDPRVIANVETMVQARLEELIFGAEEKKVNGH